MNGPRTISFLLVASLSMTAYLADILSFGNGDAGWLYLVAMAVTFLPSLRGSAHLVATFFSGLMLFALLIDFPDREVGTAVVSRAVMLYGIWVTAAYCLVSRPIRRSNTPEGSAGANQDGQDGDDGQDDVDLGPGAGPVELVEPILPVPVVDGPLTNEDPTKEELGEAAVEVTNDPVPATGQIDTKILLADADHESRTAISDLLRSAGAEVTTTTRSDEALDLARQAERQGEPFDLVLLDSVLPVLDGLQLTSELRQGGFSLPIVAALRGSKAEDRQRLVESGCDDVVARPADHGEVIGKVQTWSNRVFEVNVNAAD